MKWKITLRIWAALFVLLATAPVCGQNAVAETGKGLTAEISLGTVPSGLHVGDTFEIEIKGSNLNDLYAFEARVGLDPNRLVFVSMNSSFKGMDMTPKEEAGYVYIASTHVGKQAGISGDQVIGKLKLRIVQTGDTKVTLKQVVLLDSSLHKTMIENAGEVKLSTDSGATTQPTPQPTSKPSTQPTTQPSAPPSASPSVPNNNPSKLIVPSDKAATYFRLAEIQSDLPGKLTPVGQLYDISWTGDKAKVSLAVGSIGNLDKAKLGVYRFDLLANKWIYEGGKLNKTQTGLTFMADQPGLYALMIYNRTFTDISAHWAREAIEVIAARHIAQGITVDKFEPERLVTRAGFSAFLLRALDLSSTSETGRTFEDVDKDSWFAPVVAAAVDYGILNGDTAHIRPNDPVTREEMVVMLMRAYLKSADRKLDSLGIDERSQVTFIDAADISWWSLDNVQAARALGVIDGAGGNRFLPKNLATRAESLTIIKRMLDLHSLGKQPD